MSRRRSGRRRDGCTRVTVGLNIILKHHGSALFSHTGLKYSQLELHLENSRSANS